MRVAILGTGLIGASIGLRLKRNAAASKSQTVEVVGYDRYGDVTRTAQKIGAIDSIAHSPEQAVADADIVILATPLLAIRRMMEEIAPVVQPGTVITDVGSTKTEVMRWAAELFPGHGGFVGGHPMAGKTLTGPQAADADLFENARWIISPTVTASEQAVNVVTRMVESLGATPMIMDPAEHDAYVAAISHMPMLAATAMFSMERASDAWPELSLLATGGFRDTTRLAGTDPAMAFDIAVTNREHTIHWLNRFIGSLIDLRERLASPEHEEALFRQIAEASFEYSAFINGRVGREEPTSAGDKAAAISFQDFLAGGWMKEKMADVTGRSEERDAELEREKRLRRDV